VSLHLPLTGCLLGHLVNQQGAAAKDVELLVFEGFGVQFNKAKKSQKTHILQFIVRAQVTGFEDNTQIRYGKTYQTTLLSLLIAPKGLGQYETFDSWLDRNLFHVPPFFLKMLKSKKYALGLLTVFSLKHRVARTLGDLKCFELTRWMNRVADETLP
jgi:hypothetical protein